MVEVRRMNSEELLGFCDFTPDPERLKVVGRFPTGWRFAFAGPGGAQREFVLLPLAGQERAYAFYARDEAEARDHLPGFVPARDAVGRGDRLSG